MEKMTTEKYIERAQEVHGDTYDYSMVDYRGARDKIKIICRKHGVFLQKPYHHLNGCGCPECGGSKRKTKDEFIKKACMLHGGKYDYSNVEYVNNKTKVCIVCPEHGEFWQTPSSHLRGDGCPKCANNQKISNEIFIQKAKERHGDKYDYSQVDYKNAHTRVCIICPIHGEFWQRPDHHLQGNSCPKCNGGVKRTNEDFISSSKKIYGEKYDYSKVEIVTSSLPVTLICPVHGEFKVTPTNHLSGQGCPVCTKEIFKEKRRMPFEEVVKMARITHGDKYQYNKESYTKVGSSFIVTCPIHGDFRQGVYDHIHGYDCPKCNCIQSKTENELFSFVKDLMPDAEERNRTILNGKEIDIYIPSLKIGFEYNGLRWHSEFFSKDKFYHISKTEESLLNGCHLIHIFEDEYLEHKDLVFDKIRHIINKSNPQYHCGGRESTVCDITQIVANDFLRKYHLQGGSKSSVYLGAYNKDKILVGVMTFKRLSEHENKWELTRFATDYHYRCPGIASKMFRFFIKVYHPTEVKSFADRRWTTDKDNNLYISLGFTLEKTLPPDYHYVVGNKRIHKFNMRKQKLHKKYSLPLSMTEKEMCDALGFYRIWDCGLFKYVWKS